MKNKLFLNFIQTLITISLFTLFYCTFVESLVFQVKYYHPIHNADEEMALMYNCDVRRYQYVYDNINAQESSPIFYKTPDDAYNALNYQCQNMTMVIAHVLMEQNLLGNKTVKIFHDTERVPIFVAKV